MVGLGPLAFAPVVDGDFLPKEPWEILQEGSFNQVPTVIGYNKASEIVSHKKNKIK